MVTEPAGKSSVLYWTAASYSPPAPSLLLPPIPAAFFFRSRQMASAPPLPVTPGPGFSRGRGRRQTPACPAPPGNPRAGRRPGVQPEQAARGWRRRCRPKSGTKPSLSADPTRANFLHLLALGKQIFVMGLWGEVAESVHPASLCAAGSPSPGPSPWRAKIAMCTGDHRMAPAVFRGIPSEHEEDSASFPELLLWSVLPLARF